MAESTLSLTFANMKSRLGRWLGIGTSGWATADGTYLDELVNDGFRRFLMEADWSFLKPETTLAITSATDEYTLPDNVAGIEGPMYFSSGSTQTPIRVISRKQIRQWVADGADSGVPRYVSLGYDAIDATTGQRWIAKFYPKPDASYTVVYTYRVNPDLIDATNLYTYGGMHHSQTIMQAALAEAEAKANDTTGIQEQRYQMYLARSKEFDEKQIRPDTFGVMRDPSVYADFDETPNSRQGFNYTVTYSP